MDPNPIPGSRRARNEGCRCPVGANNHGERCPFPPDGWIVTQDCPVHGVPDYYVFERLPSKAASVRAARRRMGRS